MIEKIKLARRVKTDTYDEEILDLIDAAKLDLTLSGILESRVSHDDVLYTVETNETWSTIAIKFSKTEDELKKLNPSITGTLSQGTVITIDKCDPLILRAVTLYVKSHFGLDNQDSEKYAAAYETLKTHLCLSEEYTSEVAS